MASSTSARIAAGIVGLEGIALTALVVWQVTALVRGDGESIETGIALAVLTAAGAAAVLAFAVAVLRGQSWGRSGAVVAQVLILAVAIGAATSAYLHPLLALGLSVPAVLALVFLVLAARRADRDGEDAASADPDAPSR